MKKLDNKIINRLYALAENEDAEKFLDFMGGLDINGFAIEHGERCVYFEDGNHYVARAERLGENDGEKEKAIINYYESLGGDFGECELYEPITGAFYIDGDFGA